MRKKLARHAFLLVVFIFFANLMAMKFYWYTALPWFDQPMHFLGGLFLALATGAVLNRRLMGKSLSAILLLLLASTLFFGILWELFEYSVQTVIRFAELANVSDSFSDLLFDLLGGVIGTLFVYRASKGYNKTNG